MNDNIYRQIYNVSNDESLLTQVNEVICIFLRRGLLTAGFNLNCDLLTMHYNGYKKNSPVWDIEFFEQIINQDPLFSDRDKISRVFTCSNRNIVVPETLYNSIESKKWMETIHYKETKDSLEAHHFVDDKIYLLQLLPLSITELIKINFKSAYVLPMSIYQFRNNYLQELLLRVCITNEEACVTIHYNKMLLWHRIFDYVNASDIAYEINFFCKENQWDPEKLIMECSCVTESENMIVNELNAIFNKESLNTPRHQYVKDIPTKWTPSISLIKQLFLCV